MSLVRSKPLPAPLVELRFLVPPALVETARQAIAPYTLASVLPEGAPRQPSASHERRLPVMPVTGLTFSGVTKKELEALLRE